MKKFLAAAALSFMAVPVSAAPKTVTLSVPTMDCEVCPITVKKALTKVPGVSRTVVDFDRRQVTVNFDDAKASIEALTHATEDAGYPSTLVANAK